MLAGLFVALGFATRPPWLVFPLFFVRGGARNGGWGALRTAEARRALAAGDWCGSPCRSPSSARSWRVYNYARFEQPVRVRAQVPGRAVAGADVPLRPLQLPLPVAQPRGRAGAAAAHHDALAVRQDQPARHEPAGHLAEPRLHGDAAGAQSAGPHSGSRSSPPRCRRCSIRTRVTSSSAIATASTTWCSSWSCWRSAAAR